MNNIDKAVNALFEDASDISRANAEKNYSDRQSGEHVYKGYSKKAKLDKEKANKKEYGQADPSERAKDSFRLHHKSTAADKDYNDKRNAAYAKMTDKMKRESSIYSDITRIFNEADGVEEKCPKCGKMPCVCKSENCTKEGCKSEGCSKESCKSESFIDDLFN